MSEKTSKFRISKWFLDWVSDRGETVICYAASLKWGLIEVPYVSLIHFDPDQGTSQRTRFSKLRMPRQKEDLIAWDDPDFGVRGEWRASAPALSTRIFQSEEGYIDWQCFQPRAHSLLKMGVAPPQEGLGYAELLTMTVEPWKVPMDQLRWGRFLSAENYLVWIALGGNPPRQWVWHNGALVREALVADDGIRLTAANLYLSLDQSGVLEAEKKISNVVHSLLRFLPGIKHLIPLSFLFADEIKWRSFGRLFQGDQLVGEGWAIHELVDFIGITDNDDPPDTKY